MICPKETKYCAHDGTYLVMYLVPYLLIAQVPCERIGRRTEWETETICHFLTPGVLAIWRLSLGVGSGGPELSAILERGWVSLAPLFPY